MNKTPLYVGLIGAAAALFGTYRSWPSGTPLGGDLLVESVGQVVGGFAVAALITWLVTRGRNGYR